MTSSIDYDLHGLVGLRLLNATPKEEAVVTRQLGPIRSELQRDPDITIRFVDHLPVNPPLVMVGLNDAAYTEDAFYILKGKHKSNVKVQVPFDRLGEPVEIVCERGLPAVPLLIALINLTAFCKGVLPLHATAFRFNGVGSLITGWSKGGKSETLLGFMSHGAEYIGDEWVYISGDGRQLYGIPEPIRVWDWHLADLPQYRARLARKDRMKLSSLRLLVGALDGVSRNGLTRRSPAGKLAGRLAGMAKRQQYAHLPPHKGFGPDACPLQGSFDRLFFVASHESPAISVRPVDPQEVAARMAQSLLEEQSDLLSYYRKFRFGFPEAKNELLEQYETLQTQALQRVFAGKEAFAVFHPYPVSLEALYQAIRPTFG